VSLPHTTLSKIDVWLAWMYIRLITEGIYSLSWYIFSSNDHLMCQSHVPKLHSCIQVDHLCLCKQCYPCLIPPSKIDFYGLHMTCKDSRISHPWGFWTIWTRWSSQISQKKSHSWDMTYKVSLPLLTPISCNYVNTDVSEAVTSVLWGQKLIGNDF